MIRTRHFEQRREKEEEEEEKKERMGVLFSLFPFLAPSWWAYKPQGEKEKERESQWEHWGNNDGGNFLQEGGRSPPPRYSRLFDDREMVDNRRGKLTRSPQPVFEKGGSVSFADTPDKGMGEKPSRKSIMADTFSGKGADFSDYLAHFERVASWNRWSYEEKGMQLAVNLRGPAQQVLGNLSAEEVEDFDTLRDVLEARFNPQNRATTHRCDFRNRKWQKGESVAEFGFVLSRLGAKAYNSITQESREVIMIEQFIGGLGSLELQRHVQFGHPTTLEQAVSLAGEFVSFQNVGQDGLRKPREVQTHGTEVPVRNVEGESGEGNGNWRGGKQSRERGDKQRTERGDKPAVDAEVMGAIKELQQQIKALSDCKRAEARQGEGRGECFVCGSRQHWARECPDRHKRQTGDGTFRWRRGKEEARPMASDHTSPPLN